MRRRAAVIKRGQFTVIENERISNLRHYELAVYVHLCRMSNVKDASWPSYETLAALVGCGLTKIKESVNLLLRLHYIEKRSTQTHNIYRITYPVVQESPNNAQESPDDCCNGRQTATNKEPMNKEPDNKHVQKNGYSESFLHFYRLYPRHEGKKPAWKAWQATLKKRELFPEDGAYEPVGYLIRAAVYYREKCEAEKRETRFIKLPATFLNGEHWVEVLETKGDFPCG